MAKSQRWQANGCIDAVFTSSVLTLKQTAHLDTSVLHGDGTTTAAKKGGDNIGLSGHKTMKGDKVVIFCDRNCNVIAPLASAPGKHNKSPMFREALPQLKAIAKVDGLCRRGALISLDGVYGFDQTELHRRPQYPGLISRCRKLNKTINEIRAGEARQYFAVAH